jgi:hypothetical protein
MVPEWLHVLSIVSLAVGGACFVIVLVDVIRHPQHMWIMNVVWPVVALFGMVVAVWGYYRYGRQVAHDFRMHGAGVLHLGRRCHRRHRLQRHAAFRAGTRPGLADLRMHGAGIDLRHYLRGSQVMARMPPMTPRMAAKNPPDPASRSTQETTRIT